jgi:hypothetical protein
MDQRKTLNAPRALLKWFETLELPYKIKNFRTDLSNGFLVASIVCRHVPRVNINQFYNSSSVDKKFQNWKIIQKMLGKEDFELKDQEIKAIVFMEEMVALQLVIRIYEHYTKSKITWEAKQDEQKYHYLSTNICMLMKNHNIINTVPVHEKREKIWTTIENHVTTQKNKKSKMALKEYIRRKRREYVEKEILSINFKTAKIQENRNKNVVDDKVIVLKKYQKSSNGTTKILSLMDRKADLIDSIGAILEKYFRKIAEQDSQRQPILIPDFKSVFTNPSQHDDDTVIAVLDSFVANYKSFAEMLGNNLVDFTCFFELMSEFMMMLEENKRLHHSIGEFIRLFADIIYQDNEDFLILFMENTGFRFICNLFETNGGRRPYFAEMISAFSPSEENQLVKYICQLKEVFNRNSRDFFYLLARMTEKEVNSNSEFVYFNTVLYYAIMALKTTSTQTIVNGLKIFYNLCKINYLKIASELYTVKISRIMAMDWWEIKAMLLLISGEILEGLRLQNTKGNNDNDESSPQYHKFKINDSSSNEDMGGNLKQSQLQPDYQADATSNKGGLSKDFSFEIENNSEDAKDPEDSFSIYRRNYENFYEKIIMEIFTTRENINVIKIGILYLAPLLTQSPQFAERFFEVLISLSEQIINILLSDDHIDELLPIVLGSNGFSYRQTGLHYSWNPTIVMRQIVMYVANNQFAKLTPKLSNIITSCLNKQIKNKDEGIWLEIFINLEDLLMESFYYEDVCSNAFQILKLFFANTIIQSHFLTYSKEKLFRVMMKIYEADEFANQCGVFLGFLRYMSHEKGQHEYVFEVLKKYSEICFAHFAKSNLVDFLNQLASDRRARLFGQNALTSVLAF